MQDFCRLFGGFLHTECRYTFFPFLLCLDFMGCSMLLEDRSNKFEVTENEILHSFYIFPEYCAHSAKVKVEDPR